MVSVKKLDVCIAGVKVGTLAVTDNYLCAFEYSDEWLMNGYSISPFSLPLEKKVYIPKSYTPFDGLFGIFADSLPDGWLLEQMRRAFDGSCRGCMELMNDCFLLQLPRHLRQGGRPEDFGWR